MSGYLLWLWNKFPLKKVRTQSLRITFLQGDNRDQRTKIHENYSRETVKYSNVYCVKN